MSYHREQELLASTGNPIVDAQVYTNSSFPIHEKETRIRIADILRPIEDIDWSGKWRIKRAIELAMGDASKEDGQRGFMPKCGTSTTHTREEMVEMMGGAYMQSGKDKGSYSRKAMAAAIDALIACGAVKVRG